jgi:hypothetical protein
MQNMPLLHGVPFCWVLGHIPVTGLQAPTL